MTAIYEETTYTVAINSISNLQHNWTLVRACYSVWKDEIITARKQKIPLHEIAHVGVNYPNQLSSGKLIKTTKTFNAEACDNLMYYLQGKKRFGFNPSLDHYILLNSDDFYTDNNSKEAWCRRNIKSIKDYSSLSEATLGTYNQLCEDIKSTSLIELNSDNKRVKTELGKIKAYLLGQYVQEYSFDDIHKQMVKLVEILLELDTNMLSSMSDIELQQIDEYSTLLYNRIHSETYKRASIEEEKNFLNKVKKSK